MDTRSWRMERDPVTNLPAGVLGNPKIELPKDALVSITYLENMNAWRGILNFLLTLLVMRQLKRDPGLLYAEFRATGERKGYTLSVWRSRAMVPFRDKGSHGGAARFFRWVVIGGRVRSGFLSFLANGHIPQPSEIEGLVLAHGKIYEGGRLTQTSTRPSWPAALTPNAGEVAADVS